MKQFKKVLTGLFAFALVVSVSACGQTETTNPVGEAYPSPITITHAKGETTLETVPQKVVSLNNMFAETMVALEVMPIGATSSSADDTQSFVPYLAEQLTAAAVTNVGWQTSPDIEKVAALQPDLILASPANDDIYDKLTQIAPTIVLDFNGKGSTDWSWNELVKTVGTIFNREAEAETLIRDYEARAQAVGEQVAATYQNGEDLMYVRVMEKEIRYYGQGKQGFLYNTLNFNEPKDLPNADRSFEKISIEKLLDVDPAMIILLADKPEYFQNQLATSPLWQNLQAVQNDQVYMADYQTWQLGFGPISSNAILDDIENEILQ